MARNISHYRAIAKEPEPLKEFDILSVKPPDYQLRHKPCNVVCHGDGLDTVILCAIAHKKACSV